MSVSFELPQDIEQELRSNGVDPSREARELYLVELYRQDRISHAQLREALDVSFHEAERLIKEHGAGHDIPFEEFKAGRDFLRKARPTAR
jgi:predicted HTH domain antitoxin